MEIWFNPGCSKCRLAKEMLDEAGVDYVVRRYLDEPPTEHELATVLDRMGVQPWDIARPRETREAGITLPKDAAHRDDWIAAMVAAPITIQRPIITADDGTTTIARDPEALDEVVTRARRQD